MQSYFKISSVSKISTIDKRSAKIHKSIDSLLKRSYLTQGLWSIHKDSLGKPWIIVDDKSNLVPVSISHKNQFVFVYAGMFEQYVGVDVEEIKIFSDVLMNGFLTQEEKNYLGKIPKSEFLKTVTKIWCIKESILKAIGCGLRMRPKRINVVNLLDLQEGGKNVFEIDNEIFMCTLLFSDIKNNHVFVGISLDPSFVEKLKWNMSREGILFSGDKR